MTTTTQCSARVYHGSNDYSPSPCKHKAVVERDGKAYCTTHDPMQREKRYQAVCHFLTLSGRQCGGPAVAQEGGSIRCKRHTYAALEQERRLNAAAPLLLEAAKAALDYLTNPSYVPEEGTTRLKARQALEAAIAAAEGRTP